MIATFPNVPQFTALMVSPNGNQIGPENPRNICDIHIPKAKQDGDQPANANDKPDLSRDR
jgi:hypothetical protein